MKILGRLVFAALVSIGLTACGGSSSGSGSSGSNSASANVRKIMSCGQSSTVSCKGEDTYQSCVESKCSSAYAKCFGSGWASGNFGGVCASYLSCASKASDPCNNSGCTPDSTCLSCIESDIASCTLNAGCTLPMCTVSGAGAGSTTTGSGGKAGTSTGSGGAGATSGGTCADLVACCNKSPSNLQSACNTAYNMVKGLGDTSCGIVLSGIKAQYCP